MLQSRSLILARNLIRSCSVTTSTHNNSSYRSAADFRDRRTERDEIPSEPSFVTKDNRFSNSDRHHKPSKVIERVQFKKGEENTFGTLAEPERLKAEDLPDDDDGYDVMEKLKRRKPREWFHERIVFLIKRGGPKKLAQAMDLFREMTQVHRYPPEKPHYTLLITGCAKFGLAKHAFALFDEMMNEKNMEGSHKPTPAMVTSLINSCAECEDTEYAVEKINSFRELLHEMGFIYNHFHYNALIKAYSRHGDLKTAFELIHEMRQLKHAVTSETFSMLLMGCISNKESGFSQAIRILRQIKKLNIPIEIHIINLFLRCARDCQVGSKDHLVHLVEEWKRDVLAIESAPSSSRRAQEDKNQTSTETSLVPNLLQTSGDLVPLVKNLVELDFEKLQDPENRLSLIGGSEEIFRLFDQFKLQPTAATMTSFLYCIANTTEAENNFLRKCDQYGVKLDVDFFNMLIKRRAYRHISSKYTDDVDAVLDEINKRGLHANIVTFGVLAISCKNQARTMQFLQDMKNSGFKLNIEIMGALVKRTCYTMNMRLLKTLLEIMEEEKISADPRMLDAIKNSMDRINEILLQQERGVADNGGIVLDDDFVYNFNDFKLFYKNWLRRTRLEVPRKFSEQFEFELGSKPKTKMFQFEKEMKKKLRAKYEGVTEEVS